MSATYSDQEYEVIRDAVMESFNPPDDDGAECAVMAEAVEQAAAFILTIPCECEPGDDDGPCRRCRAVGRWHDEVVAR